MKVGNDLCDTSLHYLERTLEEVTDLSRDILYSQRLCEGLVIQRWPTEVVEWYVEKVYA
jgi:hypothetical protein